MQSRELVTFTASSTSDAAVPVSLRTLSIFFISTNLLFPFLLPSQSPIFSFKGTTQGENLGFSTSPALDVNFDGYGDLLAGAPGWNTYTGRMYLFSGQTGVILYEYTGEQTVDRFGTTVSTALDINLDAYPDFLVGGYQWDDPNEPDRGRLYLYSGKDGSLLKTLEGEGPYSSFAVSVSSASDINLDGYPDYLVGSDRWNDPNITGSGEGRMYLYSGKDHTVLSTYQQDQATTGLGTCVVAIDVNLDSYPDLMASSYGWDDPVNSTKDNGRIFVFSGKDNALLFTYQGEQPGGFFGLAARAAGDLNLDGYGDMVVGASSWDEAKLGSTDNRGRVYAISGDGNLLFALTGDDATYSFGRSVSGGQDQNLDGYPDVVVGAYNWDAPNTSTGDNRGRVYLYSGPQQTAFVAYDGDIPGSQFGMSCAQMEDMNQDGYPDLAVGAWFWDNPSNPTPGTTTNEGKVYLYSGTALTLTSDEHLLSTSMASTQNLFLNAGASLAGRKYWVFGNLLVSGSIPGVNLGSVNIPLNPDPWTQLTIDFANTPALNMTKGTLDGNGQGAASLNSLAAQPAAPLGLTLQHCYLVYQSGPPDQYFMASNLVPWTTFP